MKKNIFFTLIGFCLMALPIAAQINLLHEFAGGADDGAEPYDSLIISGTTLYGMTKSGGHEYNYGTIFKIETNGTYSLMHQFNWTAGANPFGSLIISGTTLYGMTKYGGASGMGTIFKIETDGNGFSLLHSFAGGAADGSYPTGSLIISGTTLYGMTGWGGDNDKGTIFKIETNSNGFSLLHEFAGGAADGEEPDESLIISGSTLYGTTWYGGGYNLGTVFKLETDGGGFTLLHSFAGGNDDGKSPRGSLILSDSTLYGMTIYGGSGSDRGTIFKIGISGSDFTLLYRFAGGADDGAYPYGSLILSGSTLYGMTCIGGSYSGTIFKIQTDGSGYALGHEFAGGTVDGSSPQGSLILSGSTLYGLTASGGDYSVGVVFSLPVFSIISGTITLGGSPVSGVVMSGLTGSPTTNASGFYSGTVTYGWSGTVTPTLAGHVFSPPNRVFTNVTADQTAQDYTATLMTYTISGTILAGGSPLSGVVMSGLTGSPTTNASGFYSGTVTYGWSGTVTPTLAGYTFSPASRSYTSVAANQAAQDYTATLNTYSISGTILVGSSPLTGVVMSGLPGNPATNTSGFYSGTVTYGWSGSVTPTLAGYNFSPVNRVYTNVTANQTAQDYTAAVDIKRVDFIGTWDGQGVYYRNSETAAFVKLATPATLITAGDLDGDGIDDLIGTWPGQGGVWAKYSKTGSWAKLSSTARDISAGDMNGDGWDDLLATWDGQGVYYRNSVNGAWVQMATPAEQVTAGDLDGDGKDDVIGIWPSQGGVWVKYSQTGSWAKLSTTAIDIASGDMNGDGRDDLVATWDGQGVYYRNSIGGAWVKLATPATLVAAGDLDGDAKADVIGIWPSQGGVWVKYSQSGSWEKLSTTARHIAAGLMRGGVWGSSAQLAEPMGGVAAGQESVDYGSVASIDPDEGRLQCVEENNLEPQQDVEAELQRVPGPGEYGFLCQEQQNLVPGSVIAKNENGEENSKQK